MFNFKEDSRIPILVRTLEVQVNTIKELKESLKNLECDFINHQEEINSRIRKVNNFIKEKLDIQKEDTESLLIGLAKSFESKINTLSNGKPLVTELLQKIAQLESIKDSVLNRRSTEEILNKIKEIDTQRLASELNDINTKELESELKALKWALGD